jgi:type VI secretion system protein ImpL
LASGRQSDRFSDPTRKLAKTFEEVNKLVQAAGQTPPPLDKALKAVDDFRRSVNALTSGARDKEDAALRLAKAQGDSAFQDINRQTDRLPEPLKGWLKTATTSSGGGSATTELAKLWKTEVAGTYAAAIKGRYPIFRDGSDYVTTSDFSRFFAPKGVLDQFFETNLKGFIDTGSTPWRQSTVDNRGIQLSKELLTQLQYAAKIREAFFSRGDSLRIEFKLKPVELGPNVERFTINIEGQTADYVANAPPATSPFQWPGPNRGQGVVLSFKIAGKEEPVSKLEEGDWAWFKVLDQSKLQRISMSTFHVTFQIGGYSAIYELRADSVSNPFGLSELQRFRCPESL